jgi:putative Mg2+ transporter-C (MgtC) family protein
MDWNLELLLAGRLIFAAVLGGIIGWERENLDRDAGVRTYMAVAVGSCAFSIISQYVTGDPSRIAAQVVTGMGFIGAGVILQVRGRVQGLTTAATLWATAAVGMAAAFGMYMLAGLCAVIIYGTLSLQQLPGWTRWVKRRRLKRATKAQEAQEASREPYEDGQKN